jgi:hypothetical protein
MYVSLCALGSQLTIDASPAVCVAALVVALLVVVALANPPTRTTRRDI